VALGIFYHEVIELRCASGLGAGREGFFLSFYVIGDIMTLDFQLWLAGCWVPDTFN
jgi:hypothetical protein